jgi:hypothetical protein
MVKRVKINIEVYGKLMEVADARGISVDDLANQLLEKAMD